MASKDILILISRPCEPFMAKKDIAGVIKLRILGGEDDPGLCRWTLNAITGILLRGEAS